MFVVEKGSFPVSLIPIEDKYLSIRPVAALGREESKDTLTSMCKLLQT